MVYRMSTMNADIFEALSHAQRRKLLAALLRGPTQDTELQVSEVGGIEDSDETELELRHLHLPKLSGMDFVQWDRDADTIAPGPRYERIRPVLELLETHRDQLPDGWPR